MGLPLSAPQRLVGTTIIMASAPVLLLTVIAAVVISESQAYNVDRNPFIVERRVYRDPDDPRNLFAAMYGANFKRSDPEIGNLPELTPEMFEYLKSLVQKRGRGLRDPYDPRNLFHSIYGGVFRRLSPSTRSQESQSSHIGRMIQNLTRQQL